MQRQMEELRRRMVRAGTRTRKRGVNVKREVKAEDADEGVQNSDEESKPAVRTKRVRRGPSVAITARREVVDLTLSD